MRTFIYFLVGGVLTSWLFGALLIASGDFFYNSGCLECTEGWATQSCSISVVSMRCYTLGNLESLSQFSQFMSSSGIYGFGILLFAFGRYGLLVGFVAWITEKSLQFLKHRTAQP